MLGQISLQDDGLYTSYYKLDYPKIDFEKYEMKNKKKRSVVRNQGSKKDYSKSEKLKLHCLIKEKYERPRPTQ